MAAVVKNYYKILQVDSEAEQEVIEAAYRRLARKYHPDVNVSKGTTKRMQELNEAYATLRDPTSRERYDQVVLLDRRRPPRPSGAVHRDAPRANDAEGARAYRTTGTRGETGQRATGTPPASHSVHSHTASPSSTSSDIHLGSEAIFFLIVSLVGLVVCMPFFYLIFFVVVGQ